MKSDYAKAFRIIRAAFGLSQSELAARMQATPSHLSLIEAGKRQPSLRLVDGLSNALGVPTALVTLLASNAKEVRSKPDKDISGLASSLLRLLVAANQKPENSGRKRKP